ncbi:TonB-dependent receptor [Sphingosinicella rhizophila]|uniref:TonB-dependent receptor n=1 Tax=Sphingosinicella rhizophila TaxID=3050082 RepID=A0ABU3Q1R9_9SPHN|nr:TonB-dependent receptor [Sphingosinicella sp. GR2756]MDT9597369.1 TonB-dependent receptor [Sphingosinicella sp. GR2756]
MGVGVSAVAAPAPAVAEGQTYQLDIPAQSLGDALRSLGKATRQNVVFSGAAVRGKRSAAVKGTYRVREALDRMLINSGLSVELGRGGVYMVKPGLQVSAAIGQVPTSSASANDLPYDDGDEIIVTATRREQSAQDVPASVSAVSAKQLERLRARDAEDFALTVPGLSFTRQEGGRSAFVVRGIPSLGSAATTARYLDETPQSVDPRLFDIERVEVLRGPQGTLFGSSAMGGAIRTITRKPHLGDFEGRVEGAISTVDQGGDGFDANVALNVPISRDRLALRAVGYRERVPGFVDNYNVMHVPPEAPQLGSLIKKNIGSEDIEGGRLMARWQPDTDVTIDAAYYYQRTDRNGSGSEDGELGVGRFRQNRPAGERFLDELNQFNITANIDFGFASLVSSSSYATVDTAQRADVTNIAGSFLPIFSAIFAGGADTSSITPIELGADGETRRLTQEVRLVSDNSGTLLWLAGFFYQKDKAEGAQFQVAPGAGAIFGPLAPGNSLSHFQSSSRTEEISFFGELTYRLSDTLEATIGLRRYNLETSFRHDQRGLFAFAGTLESVIDGTQISAAAEESGFTYKALLSYKPTRNLLFYAQASSGYRPGGPNSFVPPTEIPTPQPQYESDKLWQYELGWKTSWLDDRLVFNGAVFHIDWTDIQTNILTGSGYSFVGNAGAAHSQGLELELQARPVRGLNLGASMTLIDAEFDSDFPTLQVEAGDPLPNIPEFTANVNAEYRFPVSASADLYVFGQYSRVGERGASANQPITLNPYDKVDARAGVAFGGWDASVFVRNLFNEKAIIGRFTNFAGERLTYLQPRTIGLVVKTDF